MRRKDIILCSLILLLILLRFFLPKAGTFALSVEYCDVLVIWLFCGFVIRKTRDALPNAAWVLTILLCIGFGLFFSKDLCLDLIQGPKTVTLTEVSVTSTQAHTGIFSRHVYLSGINPSGKRIRLELSKLEEAGPAVTVTYYPNTGRIISCTDGEHISQVILPETYLTFCGVDPEETAEKLRSMAETVTETDQGLVLELTESQKEAFREQNQSYIDETLNTFTNTDPDWSYTIDGTSITYSYDESIKPVLQAELLMGVTAMEGFQQLLDNGDGTWQINLTICNCHTGKVVAEGTLPEETITFDETDWIKSYE